MTTYGMYVSESDDIYHHLSVEQQLGDTISDDSLLLLLWQSRPAVVIGKHQNPWRECNTLSLSRNGIKLARRNSGGGAVYHDEGNLNFSFISSRKRYRPDEHFNVVLDALREKGINASVNKKKDILVAGSKISGNSFQIRKNVTLHHGTLLIHSDLKDLRNYLKPSLPHCTGHSVRSVISPVVNLSVFREDINVPGMIMAMCKSFSGFYKTAVLPQSSEVVAKSHEFQDHYNCFSGYDWICGRSPDFKVAFEAPFSWGKTSVSFDTHRGYIRNVTFSGEISSPILEEVNRLLLNSPFDRACISNKLKICTNAKLVEFAEWAAELRF